MATFLDAVNIGYLGPVFSFLFMAVIVFAICQFIPALHGKKVVAAVLGIVIAALTLLSPRATGMIQYMVPWFAVVLFFLFMLAMLAQSFGGGGHGTGVSLGGLGGLGAVLIGGVLVIGAVSYLRDSNLYPDSPSLTGYSMRPALVIFNPLVIGTLVLLAIAACAVALLSGGGMGGGH